MKNHLFEPTKMIFFQFSRLKHIFFSLEAEISAYRIVIYLKYVGRKHLNRIKKTIFQALEQTERYFHGFIRGYIT